MKKISFAGLLICLCVALAACTATDPDNLFEIEPYNTVASTPENHEDATAAAPEDTQSNTEDIVYYTGAYQYGNMQKNMPAGNFMLLGNKVLFNNDADGRFLLYTYDLIDEEIKLYCEDATCKHKDCVAVNIYPLEVYKGKLYGTKMKEDGKWTPVIVKGNASEVILDADISSFFHHEDKWYLKTQDKSLVALEEGQKEPQMILEEYTGFWATIWGDYLYANKYDSTIIRVDLTADDPQEEVLVTNTRGITDGQFIYYVDETTFHLYRCNMDGSDSQLIEERKIHPGSTNFDDEYFYYRLLTEEKLVETPDCYDIYRFPKDDPTQIEKIATLPDPVWQVFTVPGTGKIFVTTYQHEEGEDDAVIYVMGTDGSNPTMLQIPEY